MLPNEMSNEVSMVIFSIDKLHLALDCEQIKRIFQAVDITPVPNMPANILGIINVEGEMITIIDIRNQLDLPNKELALEDFIIIAQTKDTQLGFVVDNIDFLTVSAHQIKTENKLKIITLDDNLVYQITVDHLLKEKCEDLTFFNTSHSKKVS